ncbi:hypothetical protein ACFL4E_03875, partial [Candidatus Omnitrophota bacterium]
MKAFIKIVFLLVVLAAIAGVLSYSVYKDDLMEKARISLSEKLSEVLKHPVAIGSVKYVPFQTIELEHVTIYSPDKTGTIIADADSLTITIDVLTAIREKRLLTTITTDGASIGEALASGVIRTISKESDTYEGLFDPSLIHSVSILDGLVGVKNLSARHMVGILEVDDMTVPKGKLGFKYKGTPYGIIFERLEGENAGYNITIRSEALAFSAKVSGDTETLNVDNLEGMYHTIHFDFTGEATDILSPEVATSFNGTIAADLGTFAILPGKIGTYASDLLLKGKINSKVFFKTSGTDLDKLALTSTISAENIRLDKVSIDELSTKIKIENGRLTAPKINGFFYGGVISGNFKADIWEKNIPFMLSLVLTSTDFAWLMEDVNNNVEEVYGVLDADIYLEGYAKELSSYKGNAGMTISDANLGPMPIATPLLGDIYASIEHMLPDARMVNINQAYADFDIEKRKLTTDNLTFLG